MAADAFLMSIHENGNPYPGASMETPPSPTCRSALFLDFDGTLAEFVNFLRTDPQDFRRFAILLLAGLAALGLLKSVL